MALTIPARVPGRIAKKTRPTVKAAELRHLWKCFGWRCGPPPGLSAECFGIDLAAALDYPCPGCGCCNMMAEAWHDTFGVSGYRLLLICPKCGTGEQF